jgi:hypothetical protein
MYLTAESFTFRYRNVNAVKPECSAGASDMSACHDQAMLAKAHVFKAQDFAQRVTVDKLRDRAQALLWRARAALEELDNILTDHALRGRRSNDP